MPSLGTCPSCNERFSILSVLKRQKCYDCKAAYCAKCGDNQLNLHRMMTSSAGGAGSTQIVKCCTVCILYRGGPVATNRQALQRVPVRDLKDYLAFLGISTEGCVQKSDLLDLIAGAADARTGCRPKSSSTAGLARAAPAAQSSTRGASASARSSSAAPSTGTGAETRVSSADGLSTPHGSSSSLGSDWVRVEMPRAQGYSSAGQSSTPASGTSSRPMPSAATDRGPSLMPNNPPSTATATSGSTTSRTQPPPSSSAQPARNPSTFAPPENSTANNSSHSAHITTEQFASAFFTQSQSTSASGAGATSQMSSTPPNPEAAAAHSPSRVGGHRVDLNKLQAEDIRNLSVLQLKETLAVNFVDFRGCVEKRELVELTMRLWLEKHPLPGQAVGGEFSNEEKRAATLEECRICMDEPVDCVLLECGHMCCCVKCGRQLAECPICRRYVSRVVHVFRA